MLDGMLYAGGKVVGEKSCALRDFTLLKMRKKLDIIISTNQYFYGVTTKKVYLVQCCKITWQEFFLPHCRGSKETSLGNRCEEMHICIRIGQSMNDHIVSFAGCTGMSDEQPKTVIFSSIFDSLIEQIFFSFHFYSLQSFPWMIISIMRGTAIVITVSICNNRKIYIGLCPQFLIISWVMGVS